MATTAYSADNETTQAQGAFSLRGENDGLAGTDANYTSGISMALTKKDSGLLGGVWNMFGQVEGERFSTYELTQLQFTPFDFRPDPDPLDRPYAGLLYLGFITHLQRDDSLHGFKLLAGVVGPASFAESLQRATHRILGYDLPKGWDHQLKNEPILNLLYQYRRRIALTPRDQAFGIDIIPMGGAMLGNYLIQGQVDTQMRIGYHLPADFGVTVLRDLGYLPFPQQMEHAWGMYAFAGGGANFVARDLTFDGNTFAHSRSVDKRPVVPMAKFGASVRFGRFQTWFSYILMGDEFYGQKEKGSYGSVDLSYFFK